MRAPDWLTKRPVAHRGLHDAARGIIENMPAAANAAVAGNFAIECDIQLTADGEAMVHHDDALGRLTEGSGLLATKTAAELKAVRFKDTSEQMMTLGDLCALVSGRVPLVDVNLSRASRTRCAAARRWLAVCGLAGSAGSCTTSGFSAGLLIEQQQIPARTETGLLHYLSLARNP